MSRYPYESAGGYGGRFGGLQFPRVTPAVKWLIIVNLAVQFVHFVLGPGSLSTWFGVSIAKFGEFFPLGLLNLFAYQFVHDMYGLGHIFGNMLLLYFIGTMAEEALGTKKFLRFYLVAGVVGGLFWLAFSGLMGYGARPCVGASGACYGVLTYAACRMPNRQIILLIFPVQLWIVAAFAGVVALYSSLNQLLGRTDSGVADAAHIGGMVYALVYWRFGSVFAQMGEQLERNASVRAEKKSADQDKEVDRLLRKIKDSGMSGLSGSERKFLQRYSKEQQRK